ncbi:hypothetical protein [Clostridium tetanomorphum]|uniref:Nudix hydrolase domain-containing protein n=1 Tax=Clostridium tetanomorphum TaxID=1553 RepID=A0A923J1K6_CLOTT|nr:hypothetical protein [Clostridium tetanomorphum]MBC2399341.1 hypothetical protein [Clostridium tetanomorphum]NRZ98496.1 8-oxo-dGTP pyrophosphatase MutT (NUDIX family) [Clostridium tetanomorphum]
MNYEKSCGAVIYRKVNKKIEFLIVKSRNRGHWGFAKGHVEEGENEKEIIFFLAKIKNGEIHLQEEEIAEYKWTGYELARALLDDIYIQVLEKANSFIGTPTKF